MLPSIKSVKVDSYKVTKEENGSLSSTFTSVVELHLPKLSERVRDGNVKGYRHRSIIHAFRVGLGYDLYHTGPKSECALMGYFPPVGGNLFCVNMTAKELKKKCLRRSVFDLKFVFNFFSPAIIEPSVSKLSRHNAERMICRMSGNDDLELTSGGMLCRRPHEPGVSYILCGDTLSEYVEDASRLLTFRNEGNLLRVVNTALMCEDVSDYVGTEEKTTKVQDALARLEQEAFPDNYADEDCPKDYLRREHFVRCEVPFGFFKD